MKGRALWVGMLVRLRTSSGRRVRHLCAGVSRARSRKEVETALIHYKGLVEREGGIVERRLGVRCSARKLLEIASYFDYLEGLGARSSDLDRLNRVG